MNISRLRESIETAYSLFKELLAELDADQMTQPGAIGKWSVKDTLAHIIVHEQRMIRWMRERLRREQPTLPQPYNMPDPELDELNERIYQEHRDRSLDDLLQDLARAHAESLMLVETSPAQYILDPVCFHLRAGEPLWEAIAANTFRHYEEHGQDIRKWQVTMSNGVK